MGIREYGYKIGSGIPGAENSITDVPGVKVGHTTVEHGDNKTGVTVILPCEDVYGQKPVAAVYTLNGYGKTAGTIQIEELGVLETPIALTNTLNVGKVLDGLVEYTLQECRKRGRTLTSVNPVVGETNDSRINQITSRAVEKEDVLQAIDHADKAFEQGAVGAGRGTVCFGLKGGIGSSSRVFAFGGREYTVGVLVQSNFGSMEDMMLCGEPIGQRICEAVRPKEMEDKGSIMIVVGTDLPISSRQLRRVLKRATAGLVRTGSFMGHGSGDVFLGFSTGNCMKEKKGEELIPFFVFPENQLNLVFRQTAEAVEEAILNSLVCAETDCGRSGEVFHSLKEFL